MNLDVALFTTPMLISAMGIWLLFVLYAAFSVRWYIVREHWFIVHIFFSVCLGLTLFAMLRTGVMPNLGIHLMGLTAATLMMGWRFAILASAISLSLTVIIGLETPMSLGFNGLLFGVLPIMISYGFCRLLQKFLPHNPFVFTIGAAFFGGCFAIAGAMLSTALLLDFLNIYQWAFTWDKYTKFMPVIVYPEGFVNGVFVTAMVAFHPRLLSCFDTKSYFKVNT